MPKRHRKQQRKFPPVILLGVVLLAGAILILLLQGGAGKGTPVLAVDPRQIEYGDVKLNTELTFEIKVTNQGDGVLRFKDQPYIEVLEGC